MKKTTKKHLRLSSETVAILTGQQLRDVYGGIITGGTSGEPECPTTVGYPGCESTACPGTGGSACNGSCIRVCNTYPLSCIPPPTLP
jgi:hypothetical protein